MMDRKRIAQIMTGSKFETKDGRIGFASHKLPTGKIAAIFTNPGRTARLDPSTPVRPL